METIFLIWLSLNQKKSLAESRFSVEPGKNYSLLIDNERIPLTTQPHQEIYIRIFNSSRGASLPGNRVKISHLESHDHMAAVKEPRFRFYYNTPRELKDLFEQEKLHLLRKGKDWDTIVNVMEWAHRQIRVPGNPKSYPPQSAVELVKLMREGSEKGFCAQYCYLTVQALQALGYFSRYLTINGHEVCEVWVPQFQKWVCLDPMNSAYFEDPAKKKLSALEISRNPDQSVPVSNVFEGSPSTLIKMYEKLWFWLRNDVATNPINIYDLNKYRCRAILKSEDLQELQPGDLYTLYPEELYAKP